MGQRNDDALCFGERLKLSLLRKDLACPPTTVCCIIYLYLPTAVKQAFALFNCYEVGGEPFLLADLEEPCYEGRHSMFLMLVGLPQLTLFVVGMPGLGFYFLTRNRSHLRGLRLRIFN